MAGDPDYQPMKTELDALATATAAIEAAVDLARSLTQTTPYEENSTMVQSYVRQFAAVSGTEYVAVDVEGKGVVTNLEFSSGYKLASISLIVDGVDIYYASGSGAVLFGYDFSSVNTGNNGETGWFRTYMYDDTKDYYYMRNTKPIYFNDSIYVSVKQQAGAAKRLGCVVNYRIRT